MSLALTSVVFRHEILLEKNRKNKATNLHSNTALQRSQIPDIFPLPAQLSVNCASASDSNPLLQSQAFLQIHQSQYYILRSHRSRSALSNLVREKKRLSSQQMSPWDPVQSLQVVERETNSLVFEQISTNRYFLLCPSNPVCAFHPLCCRDSLSNSSDLISPSFALLIMHVLPFLFHNSDAFLIP